MYYGTEFSKNITSMLAYAPQLLELPPETQYARVREPTSRPSLAPPLHRRGG
jgi:hypothetical protein